MYSEQSKLDKAEILELVDSPSVLKRLQFDKLEKIQSIKIV
jgi:hypothetical protein